MLSAKEAKSLYNPVNKLAKFYLKTYLDPQIRVVAEDKHYINLKAVSYSYLGYALEFPEELDMEQTFMNKQSHHADHALTKEIIDILKNLGYQVAFKTKQTEKENVVICRISWE